MHKYDHYHLFGGRDQQGFLSPLLLLPRTTRQPARFILSCRYNWRADPWVNRILQHKRCRLSWLEIHRYVPVSVAPIQRSTRVINLLLSPCDYEVLGSIPYVRNSRIMGGARGLLLKSLATTRLCSQSQRAIWWQGCAYVRRIDCTTIIIFRVPKSQYVNSKPRKKMANLLTGVAIGGRQGKPPRGLIHAEINARKRLVRARIGQS
ncbi:hypothetical protein F4778DRAFT_458054 [Xylariomycetidae sp. FL2044]|nr:hypothetical protein F4778DRAFT_458054 [Xylariomycetidae sp. FL2044]